MTKKKLLTELFTVLIVIPLLVGVGSFVFYDRRYMLVSAAIAVVSCLLFFLAFEGREGGTKRLVILSAMTALSVVGRFIFAPIPFFKPVTAIVVICGIHLGCEAGFLCGSLSAFLSKSLQKSRAFLILFGVLSGVVYSAFMDIWTTVWFDGTFITSRYLAALAAALPVTAIYAVSNVAFLLVLSRPVGEKLERIRKKYGL